MNKAPVSPALRLAVLDDHPLVVKALSTWLGRRPGLKIAIQETNASRFLHKFDTHPCPIALLDYNLPGQALSDNYLIRHMRDTYPDLAVITLSGDDAAIEDSRVAGSHGFFSKREPLQLLPALIQRVRNGNSFVFARHGKLASKPIASTHVSDCLSRSEMDVLRGLASGLSLTDFARSTNRHPKTASQQKRNAMRKLGLADNAALATWLRTHF